MKAYFDMNEMSVKYFLKIILKKFDGIKEHQGQKSI